MKQNQVDPLYLIFEQHLLNFQDPDTDRRTLVLKIVAEYINYLRKQNISVPRALEQPIVEELYTQVNTMLVKKIYGCLTTQDFQSSASLTVKKQARSRYTRLTARAARPPKEAKEKS